MNGTSNLATVDYLIIIAYLLGTVIFGLIIGRKFKTGKDFFLAGRSLPWWAIGMSLVASDIGGTDIIGLGGSAYSFGVAVANFEWIGCVPAMILGAFLFVPVFWRMGIYTIPEFMERRFNVGIRSALAVCWLAFMACNLGIMLYAAASMLSTVLGWEFSYSFTQLTKGPIILDQQHFYVVLTAILVGVYTFAGGLKAVVYTDTIQCVVMIGGCLLVLVFGLVDLGGWGGMMEKIDAMEARTDNHGELIVPADSSSPFVWPGILFGLAFILSPAYWIGNQAIVQRSLGAKSQFHAQAAYVWGGLLKILIPVIIVIPGLIALAKFPDLVKPDDAFPTLVSHVLPIGFRGLFLAAFVAALMSSVDSYLNASATVITNDFYLRFFDKKASDARILTVGRTCTAVLMVWAIGFAFWISMAGGDTPIFLIFQTLLAFFQGPTLAVILCGFLWKRANGIGALVGFISGIAVSVSLWALNKNHEAIGIQPLFKVNDPFLYISIWAFLTSLLVILIVSLVTKADGPEQTEFLTAKKNK